MTCYSPQQPDCIPHLGSCNRRAANYSSRCSAPIHHTITETSHSSLLSLPSHMRYLEASAASIWPAVANPACWPGSSPQTPVSLSRRSWHSPPSRKQWLTLSPTAPRQSSTDAPPKAYHLRPMHRWAWWLRCSKYSEFAGGRASPAPSFPSRSKRDRWTDRVWSRSESLDSPGCLPHSESGRCVSERSCCCTPPSADDCCYRRSCRSSAAGRWSSWWHFDRWRYRLAAR